VPLERIDRRLHRVQHIGAPVGPLAEGQLPGDQRRVGVALGEARLEAVEQAGDQGLVA